MLRKLFSRKIKSPLSSPADLPYYTHLRDFEKKNRILHRNDIYGCGPPSDIASAEIVELIKKYAERGESILDIGCGIGAYIKELSRFGFKCTGIEYNLQYVEKCQSQGLVVKHMNAEKLNFDDNSFDTTLMIEILEHVEDPSQALTEAFRVSKLNIIISVPNIDILPIMSKYNVVPWHLLESTHLNFFTPVILENLLKKISNKTIVQTFGQFAPWVTEQIMHMHILGVIYKV
jgi:ubiquinone/menaquinone biosynthesis C-methylase UbiE